MKIARAKTVDAKDITALTIRSKDYWGYGDAQIEKWRAELTITADYINANQVFKLINEDKLLGFYAYQATDATTVNLNFLFVEPHFIGQKYGKLLIEDFLNRIAKDGFRRATLDADPNAEKFYERFGFKVIGKLETSIKDRFLPVMEYKIH